MLLNFSKILVFVSIYVIVITNAQKITKTDIWKSNESFLKDENEDLHETNKILKRLRENLSSANSVERQQNLNLISDVVNRLVQRLQTRLTPAVVAAPVPANDDVVVDEEIVNALSQSAMSSDSTTSGNNRPNFIETLIALIPSQRTTTQKPLSDDAPSVNIIQNNVTLTTTTTTVVSTNSSAVTNGTEESTLNQSSINISGSVRTRRPTVFAFSGKCKAIISAENSPTTTTTTTVAPALTPTNSTSNSTSSSSNSTSTTSNSTVKANFDLKITPVTQMKNIN